MTRLDREAPRMDRPAPRRIATSEERRVAIERRISLVAAICGLLLLALQASEAVGQTARTSTWWTTGALALVCLGVVLVPMSLWAPASMLRQAWIGYALAQLVLGATWSIALVDGGDLDDVVAIGPWTWALEPFAIALAALAWRPVAAFAYAFTSPLAVLLTVHLSVGVSVGLGQAFVLHLGNAAFAVVVMAVRAQTSAFWEGEALAAEQARELSNALAWARERARVSAVVHDEVLATLQAATRTTGAPSVELRGQATRALAALETGVPRSSAESVPSTVLVRQLHDLATAARAEFTTGARVTIEAPSDVVDHLIAAAGEALRNSARHARPVRAGSVSRAVEACVLEDAITVTISDDGSGFAANEIGQTRLGVRGSITGRMASVPGGRARVESAPGEGTVVTLTWTRT